ISLATSCPSRWRRTEPAGDTTAFQFGDAANASPSVRLMQKMKGCAIKTKRGKVKGANRIRIVPLGGSLQEVAPIVTPNILPHPVLGTVVVIGNYFFQLTRRQ